MLSWLLSILTHLIPAFLYMCLSVHSPFPRIPIQVPRTKPLLDTAHILCVVNFPLSPLQGDMPGQRMQTKEVSLDAGRDKGSQKVRARRNDEPKEWPCFQKKISPWTTGQRGGHRPLNQECRWQVNVRKVKEPKRCALPPVSAR